MTSSVLPRPFALRRSKPLLGLSSAPSPRSGCLNVVALLAQPIGLGGRERTA